MEYCNRNTKAERCSITPNSSVCHGLVEIMSMHGCLVLNGAWLMSNLFSQCQSIGLSECPWFGLFLCSLGNFPLNKKHSAVLELGFGEANSRLQVSR